MSLESNCQEFIRISLTWAGVSSILKEPSIVNCEDGGSSPFSSTRSSVQSS